MRETVHNPDSRACIKLRIASDAAFAEQLAGV